MQSIDITETVRYTINTTRLVDGIREQGTMTATVTQVLYGYKDFWTGETHPVAYRFTVLDSLTGVTSLCTLPDDEFTSAWVDQSI